MTAHAVLLLVVGLPLALVPRQAVRAAGALRFLPVGDDPTERQVLGWRRWGAAAVALGVVALALA